MSHLSAGRRSRILLILLLTFVSPPAVLAASPIASGETTGYPTIEDTPQRGKGDFTGLTIEELMDIEITSTAKKPIKLSHATSAIFVITSEDIRRSGATTIPDLLRMVPGLDVARISANQWAVSARGFNGRFANKLLVMIDGRSIYTPTFSGVYWEVQDPLLEDIERIEVIRGPGATLWGANAVNGVINIITRPAPDSRGGLVSAYAGTEERGGGVRYGARTGTGTDYRMYAKYLDRDGSVSPGGMGYEDEGELVRAGFRVDTVRSSRGLLTFSGDAYAGIVGQMLKLPSLTAPFQTIIEDDARVSGGNLLARWRRDLSASSGVKAQVFYDAYRRLEATQEEERKTLDLEFDHHFSLTERHALLWGMGYRTTADRIDGTFFMSAVPTERRDDVVSAFLQDDVTLSEAVMLTVGTKLEHNDYSGTEVQPNLRLLWTPSDRYSAWAAVSRAVRTPSRIDADSVGNTYVYPTTPPSLVRILGSDSFRSEELLAYEAGYRVQPAASVFLDAAVFYNVYDDLRTGEPGTPFPEATPAPPHQVLPFTAANGMGARVYGLEMAANWHVRSSWTLDLAYTFLEMELHRDRGSFDVISENAEGESPHHQVSLRSALEPRPGLEIDLWLRYVDELPYLTVEQYLTLDLRIGWRPRKDIEVVLAGQNLLDDRHNEFQREVFFVPSAVERSFYGKVAWTF